MPPRPTPDRLAILVLIVVSVVAACDRKHDDGSKVKAATPRPGGTLPPVVPALGIRG
jgi:hypothetical protein